MTKKEIDKLSQKLDKEVEIDYKLIGKRLREIRKDKNIVQYDVASILNVSSEYISKIENGKCLPSFNVILKMCKLYDVDLFFILEGINAEESNYLNNDLSDSLSKLSSDQKRFILRFCEEQVKYNSGK